MGWVVTAVGGLLVLAVLRDIFHTLIHPAGQGTLAKWTFSVLWRLSRSVRRRGSGTGDVVGPLGVVVVIGLWAALIVSGWALVYLPWLPQGLVYSQGLVPEQRSEVLDAFYLSLVSLTTLGFGDVAPQEGWLRVAVPLEGLVGFTLLTAVVSWVLQVYPALARRRELALRLQSLRRADPTGGWLDDDSPVAAGVLHGLAAEVSGVQVDLTQYAETYYFRDPPDVGSLPSALGVASDLAHRAAGSPRADVRLAGRTLGAALDDLADLLGSSFLPRGGTTTELLDAYAADHGKTPRRLE